MPETLVAYRYLLRDGEWRVAHHPEGSPPCPAEEIVERAPLTPDDLSALTAAGWQIQPIEQGGWRREDTEDGEMRMTMPLTLRFLSPPQRVYRAILRNVDCGGEDE